MEVKRLEKLTELLAVQQAAIISDDNNRFYITGMRSSAGIVLIIKEKAYLLIDFRYYEKAKAVAKGVEVILCEHLFEQIKEILKLHNVKSVLLEAENVTLSTFESFKKNLSDFEVQGSTELSKCIKALRSIKSADEIEYIKQAQAITDKAFTYILNKIKCGVSELEIMLDMEFFMRKLGSEGVAFDSIVVSGKNSSLPHGIPTEKEIQKGDFVTMDFGAVVQGYRSDMTRTVAVGYVDYEKQKVYETVLTAQKSALKIIKPEVKCCKVDKIARDIIDDAGYKGCFGHGLGHSVGLEIHENPCFNKRDDTLLQSGMIMTVEPGIYIENKFGVRIEDMVLVTDDGIINLTNSTKELIIL